MNLATILHFDVLDNALSRSLHRSSVLFPSTLPEFQVWGCDKSCVAVEYNEQGDARRIVTTPLEGWRLMALLDFLSFLGTGKMDGLFICGVRGP